MDKPSLHLKAMDKSIGLLFPGAEVVKGSAGLRLDLSRLQLQFAATLTTEVLCLYKILR